MAIFSYKATTSDGVIINGVIEAADEKSAVERLKNSGILLLKINTQGEKTKRRFLLKSSREDLLTFTTELSTLLDSGLPLDMSLSMLSEISESAQMRDTIKSILKSIREGSTFSDALQRHPRIFPRLYVNMMRAGEAGGALNAVLDKLGEFLETTKEIKDYVFSSMIYPVILFITGVISIIILLTFMVPKFTSIFAELGSSLPLATRFLLGFSNAIRAYWLLFFLFIIAGWSIFRRYIKSDKGRYNWDAFKLRIMGDVIRKLETARFCRTLGTLLRSGVPMLQALNNAKDVINNQVIAFAIDSLFKGAKEGKGIAVPLSEANVFPPLAVSMVKVGEETGQLDNMLIKVAVTYEKSLKVTLRKFISLLEPAMILLMGLVIGFIVLSMLMAIFSISDLPF